MTKIRSMLVDQSMVGEPERRGDERSEAPRSGGSPTVERAAAPGPPDSEVPARHARRRFTTAYKLEILRKADEWDADVVIMGTHGKGIIQHAFLGSVSERVLHRIRKPVYIIPLPEGETDITLGEV